jgi:hypothetical protein
MLLDGIMTDAAVSGNAVCIAPVNPGFLNFQALGVGTNSPLGLMPHQVDATALLGSTLYLGGAVVKVPAPRPEGKPFSPVRGARGVLA